MSSLITKQVKFQPAEKYDWSGLGAAYLIVKGDPTVYTNEKIRDSRIEEGSVLVGCYLEKDVIVPRGCTIVGNLIVGDGVYFEDCVVGDDVMIFSEEEYLEMLKKKTK